MSRRTSAELQAALTHLWREFKNRGSIKARTGLIEHYRYLITKTRQRIIPTVPVKIAAEDLDQEGYIALVKAVDHFDPRRKVKFESYAISTVRGAMLEYLRREDWVPRSVRSKQKLLHRAEEDLALRKGIENVTDSDMAAYLELPIDAFYQLYYEANVLQVVSLEDVVGDSEHEDLDPLVVLESMKKRGACCGMPPSSAFYPLRFCAVRPGVRLDELPEVPEPLVAALQQAPLVQRGEAGQVPLQGAAEGGGRFFLVAVRPAERLL